MSSESIRSRLAAFATPAEAMNGIAHCRDGRDLQHAVDRIVRADFHSDVRELLQVAYTRQTRALGLVEGLR